MLRAPSCAGLAVVAVVGGAFLLGACGSDDGDDEAAASIEGTIWVLTELAGEPVPDGVEVTLEFDGATIAGSGGCNRYNTAATFDDGVASIAPEIISTKMACPDPQSTVEFDYLQTLPRAESFSVEGNTLRLDGADDEALLVFTTDE